MIGLVWFRILKPVMVGLLVTPLAIYMRAINLLLNTGRYSGMQELDTYWGMHMFY